MRLIPIFMNTMDEASIGWMERRTGGDGRETYVRNSVVGTVPITYLGRDQKQYVAIVAGGRSALDGAPNGADALMVYALP